MASEADDQDAQGQDTSMHYTSDEDERDEHIDFRASVHGADDVTNPSRAPAVEQAVEPLNASESETNSEDEDHNRPNRFNGPPRTYRRYISPERKLHASLEQIRAGNLSVHLYNAFALKSRHRKKDYKNDQGAFSHESKRRWIDEENRHAWVPPNRWTAWPLPSDHVPQIGEAYGKNDASQRKDENEPSEELREVLLGHILHQGRLKWAARKWDSDEDDRSSRIIKKRQKRETRPADASIATADRPERSTPSNAISAAIEISSDDDSGSSSNSSSSYFSSHPAPRPTQKKGRRPLNTSSSESESVEGNRRSNRASPLIKSQSSPHNVKVQGRSDTEFVSDVPSGVGTASQVPPRAHFSTPTISADEDKARRILAPSIRSAVTKLDSLLFALQISRDARSDFTGRPGMQTDEDKLRLTNKSTKEIQSLERSGNTAQDRPPQSERQSRPVSRASNRGLKPSTLRPGSSHSITTDGDYSPESEVRSGLRDWSEILGIASLSGWNEQVVERAAKRCATLFGESMSFRTLSQEEEPDSIAEAFEYQRASKNQDLSTEDIESYGEGNAAVERPPFDPFSLRCPHKECKDRADFPQPFRVVEHIKRVHKYDPKDTAEEFESDLEGGVHVDGFLKPISRKQGWRSADVKVKRQISKSTLRRRKKKASRTMTMKSSPLTASNSSGTE